MVSRQPIINQSASSGESGGSSNSSARRMRSCRDCEGCQFFKNLGGAHGEKDTQQKLPFANAQVGVCSPALPMDAVLSHREPCKSHDETGWPLQFEIKNSRSCVNSAGTLKAQTKAYDCHNHINAFVRCRWLFSDLSSARGRIWRGSPYFHRRQDARQVRLRHSQARLLAQIVALQFSYAAHDAAAGSEEENTHDFRNDNSRADRRVFAGRGFHIHHLAQLAGRRTRSARN
jgi:hypothetical protein